LHCLKIGTLNPPANVIPSLRPYLNCVCFSFRLDKVKRLYILSIFIMHTRPCNIVLSQTAGPLYQQIVNQIKQKIAIGEWVAGEEIPSIRQFAADLRVSVITVKRAYLEMEHAGLIVTQHGKGSFIAANVVRGPEIFEHEMVGHLEEAARLGATMGMSERELVSRLRKALDETEDARLIPKPSKESA
jgi:GntR family transcriptional regulator